MKRSSKHTYPIIKIFIPVALLLTSKTAYGQEEYSFDISAYEKSPFEFGGYAELRWEKMRLDKDAAVYLLNYFDDTNPDTINRYTATLQLEGRYHQDDFSAVFRFNPEAYSDDFDHDAEFNAHEAYLSWQAKPSFALDIGKKLLKWGKGYAWNPAGFVERPKDPNEPDLAREGYTIIGGDWIISRAGDLQTIAITPLYLPVTDNFNEDFGTEDDNYAGKVYFLYKDTDIDLMFLSEGSRTARYGFDFSRNITTNFEIHGEWAYITDFNRKYLTAQNDLVSNVVDVQSWLFGLRYLTESDTTYIIEYYYNGTGLTKNQMQDFYGFVEDIPNQPNPDLALSKARSIADTGFVKQSAMREYLYIRASQKDPFDWLYVTPAVTVIINLQDQSYNISPEIVYTGINDLELRAKFNILAGRQYTEFGEKQNDTKLEILARYHF